MSCGNPWQVFPLHHTTCNNLYKMDKNVLAEEKPWLVLTIVMDNGCLRREDIMGINLDKLDNVRTGPNV